MKASAPSLTQDWTDVLADVADAEDRLNLQGQWVIF